MMRLFRLYGNILNSGFIALFFVAFSIQLSAQKDKTTLQERKAKIEREISYTNQLLSETKKSKQSNLNQLYLINKKINKGEDLIR